MGRLETRVKTVAIGVALMLIAQGCSQESAGKRYPIEGQILALDAQQRTLTVKHGDIVGFMPAMTMTFPVTKPELMTGRKPGELIKGTLEVTDYLGRLVDVQHVGEATLPPANEMAVAAGLLEPGSDVPDVALIDQNDKRRSTSEWKGSPVVITFIYTRCPLPNFCPLMDQNFAALQGAIKKDPALNGKAQLMSVTFDPDHDTPPVLAAQARKMKADPAVWTFLTGDRATLDGFAMRFGVGVIRETDAGQTITHNLRTTLVGADGKVIKFWTGSDWTPSSVLADLRAAAGAK